MPIPRGFERLLRIRTLEEEQSRAALAAALAELNSFTRALEETLARAQGGRRLLHKALASGEISERLAGLVEISTAKIRAEALTVRLREAERRVDELKSELLGRQVKRRQSEILVDRLRTLDALEADRRIQRELDEWYRARKPGKLDAR
ncbi:MAG TPA: hypothetical protein VL967_09620 [Terracidiphilus sp.]|nr:hypothetical protein [Terracidiphilus sp.]